MQGKFKFDRRVAIQELWRLFRQRIRTPLRDGNSTDKRLHGLFMARLRMPAGTVPIKVYESGPWPSKGSET